VLEKSIAGRTVFLVADAWDGRRIGETIARFERAAAGARARSAIVLACVSASYFGPILRARGAHPLLMTRSLMAPEAYTLDAALSRWLSGGTPGDVRSAAAAAYCLHQKCKSGLAMFTSDR